MHTLAGEGIPIPVGLVKEGLREFLAGITETIRESINRRVVTTEVVIEMTQEQVELVEKYHDEYETAELNVRLTEGRIVFTFGRYESGNEKNSEETKSNSVDETSSEPADA